MSQRVIPAGTVTFLFTDIEGSTRLWEAHPEKMRVSLARHDALMRQVILECGGYVFKTIGDAFCAAFSTAPKALEAVLESQLALINEPWPKETPIRVRMALHTGAVESRDDDYFGPPVNRVARLLSVGHGGQCLLSQVTHELVRDSLPPSSFLQDLGTHQLKDLARPEQIFQLMHPALPSEFASLRSLSNQPNNLPIQLTSFVGREEEIAQARSLFSRSRLVTLAGAGGSGKTRLGLQVAAELLDAFPDGVWLIELAPVSNPDALVRTVAQTLKVTDDGKDSLQNAIVDAIGSRAVLMILDNCEHVIQASAQLADSLLRSCPQLKILATSREPLGIAGESTLKVLPLSLPDPAKSHTSSNLSQFAAVRLFIERAQQVNPDFAVTNENAPALASICCQLDGIPLAIELAAARSRSMPLEQIEGRLDRRFQLLTGGSRAALPRQQTLRALIDWSYDLLGPAEKTVFHRLSVFSGGWTLEAAEAVCADEALESWEVLDILLSLADKSIVVAQTNSDVPRYSYLESIREYAKERLVQSGEELDCRDRHLSFFVRVAEEASQGLRGQDQKAWLKRLDPDQDNFRAALEFGCSTPEGLKITGNIWWYWYFRGRLTEGRMWLMSALEQNPQADPMLRAHSLNGAGVLAEYQGDQELALDLLHQSVEVSEASGDRWHMGMSLNNIGNVHGTRGDFEAAASYWNRAHETWLALEGEGLLSDRRGLAATVDNLGNVALASGDHDTARTMYQRGFDLRMEAQNLALAAYSLVNLGGLELEAGNEAVALDHYQKGLRISHEVGDNYGIYYFLGGLAHLADPLASAKLLGKCEVISEELGLSLSPAEKTANESVVTKALSQVAASDFGSALAEGRQMEIDHAVELALRVSV